MTDIQKLTRSLERQKKAQQRFYNSLLKRYRAAIIFLRTKPYWRDLLAKGGVDLLCRGRCFSGAVVINSYRNLHGCSLISISACSNCTKVPLNTIKLETATYCLGAKKVYLAPFTVSGDPPVVKEVVKYLNVVTPTRVAQIMKSLHLPLKEFLEYNNAGPKPLVRMPVGRVRPVFVEDAEPRGELLPERERVVTANVAEYRRAANDTTVTVNFNNGMIFYDEVMLENLARELTDPEEG